MKRQRTAGEGGKGDAPEEEGDEEEKEKVKKKWKKNGDSLPLSPSALGPMQVDPAPHPSFLCCHWLIAQANPPTATQPLLPPELISTDIES